MAQRELIPLTAEERKRVGERIIEIRKEIGYNIGDPITYDVIKKAHTWCISRFRYVSDDYNYKKLDFWNPLVFEWLLLDDYLEDDCDGYGYAILLFLLNVLKVKDSNLFRVSCQAETGEGHFVAWIKADDGIFYQVENRVRIPRTLRYMRDLGYVYWHYSDLTPKNIKPNRWYNAEKRASEIIYHTPPNLKADEPIVKTRTLVENIPTSKTLQLGTGVGASTIVGILGALANSTDWKIVALVGGYGILLTILIFYIRGKTFTPLEVKRKLQAGMGDFIG